jgi:hypothetical protein
LIGLALNDIDDVGVADDDILERLRSLPSLGKTGSKFDRMRKLCRTDRRAGQDGSKELKGTKMRYLSFLAAVLASALEVIDVAPTVIVV